jgi:hypothetical protein
MDVDFLNDRVLLSGWVYYYLPDTVTIVQQDEFHGKKISLEYATELFEAVNKEKMWESLKAKDYDDSDEIPF